MTNQETITGHKLGIWIEVSEISKLIICKMIGRGITQATEIISEDPQIVKPIHHKIGSRANLIEGMGKKEWMTDAALALVIATMNLLELVQKQITSKEIHKVVNLLVGSL